MIGSWRSRLAYRIAHLALRRFVAGVQLSAPASVSEGGRSRIVVANHQSALDVALAIEISARLGYQFATWAHSEVIRRAPILRRFGALEASRSPQAVARLMSQTRELLRRPGSPVLLWIFPEGRFGHRMEPIKPSGGAVAAAQACGGVPVLACGFDYTVFRGLRPHASVVLMDCTDHGMSLPNLAEVLESARAAAADLSRRRLPQRAPASFLHPAGWRAGRRARDPWFHQHLARPDCPVAIPHLRT